MPPENNDTVLVKQTTEQQNINVNQSMTTTAPPVETEEEREIRLQAEAMRRAREHRQNRIQAIRQGCRVQMPDVAFTRKGVTVQGEVFAKKSKESIGAGKRKMRQGWKCSALYQKEMNAKRVEDGVNEWEASRQELIERHPILEGMQNEREKERIAQFLTGNEERDTELMVQVFAGNQAEIAKIAVRQFMELDLNVDLRTDRALGEASMRMEGIANKTRALKFMLERNPEALQSLTEDQRLDLDTKLGIAENLSNYYEIQKKVITNTRYRSHYTSEISYRYHDGDTLEEKNLSVLLWQAERLRSSQKFSHPTDLEGRLRDYQETLQNQEEVADTQKAKRILQSGDAEFGKNTKQIEDSRHAAYFRAHQDENDPIVKRLVGEAHYQVTGMPEAMSESFVRNLANLPRWRAIQNAEPEYVQRMVENLIQKPQNMEDQEEVTRCQEANLEGMRQFKALLKKQMNYLKRKYGNGLPLISMEELEAHGAEFANDFTNMQGLGAFIDYLKKLPGMFDPDNESDAEMEQLYMYYDRCVMGEGVEQKAFKLGSTGSATYADYKRRVAITAVNDESRAEAVVKMNDTMHLDIRWNVPFEEAPEAPQQEVQTLRLTRQEAISSHSDQLSEASRMRLSDLNQALPAQFQNVANLVDAYVRGMRYTVGYTEERKRLQKAIDAVEKALRKEQNETLLEIKQYFDQMTNGTLIIPEDDEVQNFIEKSPKETGLSRAGTARTELLRTFTHWSNQKDTPLFSHEPTVNDLKQRFVSNCYMVASTAGVVDLDPDLIKSCIKDNGDGTVTVRLYENRPVEEEHPQVPEEIDGLEIDEVVRYELAPIYVRVTKEIPRIAGADVLSSGALWMQMIEKACAFVGRNGSKGYRSLWYGEGGAFLERLLGVSPVAVEKNEALFENLLHAREHRFVYNAGSKNTVGEEDGLNAGHAYTVMGAKEENGQRYVLLRNPYSTMSLQEEEGRTSRTGRMLDTSSDETYGQFYMKFEEFLEKFQTITYTDLNRVQNID